MINFKNPIIRSEKHLRFIASLPCLVTGMEIDVQAHHLLRGTGQKGMGQKAGDNWSIPLHFTIHDALHRSPKGETRFLADHGVKDAPNAAAMLYTYTMDHWEAERFIKAEFEANWKKRLIR